MLPGFHGLHLIFLFFFFGIAILGTIFWIWMLIDCATKEPAEGSNKIVWILIILFTHFVGALIYYTVRRPERMRMLGY